MDNKLNNKIDAAGGWQNQEAKDSLTPEKVDQLIQKKINDDHARFLYESFKKEKLDTFSNEVMETIPSNSREPIYYTQSGYIFKGLSLSLFGLGKALNVDPEQARRIAGSVDFLFNLSLIFDDIKDADTVRDGQAAAWVKYGRTEAEEAFQSGYNGALENIRLRIGEEPAEILKKDVADAVRSLDKQKEFTFDTPMEDLFKDWDQRSLHLYDFPLRAYAALVPVTPEKLQAGIESMRLINAAGQFYNDLRDIYTKRFSDFKNGYVTVPEKIMWDNSTDKEREIILAIMGKSDWGEDAIKNLDMLIKTTSLYSKSIDIMDEYLKSAENLYNGLVSEKECQSWFNEYITYIKNKLTILRAATL